ncbi:hypothetical protein AK830_g8048 [Neonectria ditissima]|uniref:Cytochrome P450 monooxygenase eqxH n=1 Tax=Neonectria ditissima TaxID=78410 RepID=A0A0P7BDI0_9HYPO|nr:hypothetical protein AK830_g8048 [Neonectria ditissima]
MALQHLWEAGMGPSILDQPLAILVITILMLTLITTSGSRHTKFPELDPKRFLEFTNRNRTANFIRRSKELLVRGKAQFHDQPYRVYSDWGEIVVLPSRFIEELRSHPHLNFDIPAQDDSHAYIPGFDPFVANDRLPQLVTKYLTRALTKLTAPISQEATQVLKTVLTDSSEWHEIDPKIDLVLIVSRMSTRVFMGEELCKNDKWVQVSSDYTLEAFRLSNVIRSWPRSFRPIIHWALPSCWRLRRKLDETRRVLQPYIERRARVKAEALARGEPSPFDDSIEWFEKEYKTAYDPATAQITLSLVAIHTTSDLLQQVMLDVAQHPDLMADLRREIIQVLGAEGLKKTSLYNLKLMDSVIKESQRLKPILLAPIRRLVMKDIELSDGTIIRKNQKVVAGATHMWDSSYYENGATYDGYRFLRMRETPDEGKHAHLVSTSANHIGFGHGQHACPGRFFAANEIKIALCHILLKYDWKLPEGFVPKPIAFGMAALPDPTAKILIKRRKEEIDMDTLES